MLARLAIYPVKIDLKHSDLRTLQAGSSLPLCGFVSTSVALSVIALTPAGVPGRDGAGAGLICHGDHGHDDAEEEGRGGGGRLVVHCRFRGKEGEGHGQGERESDGDRSTSLLYPRTPSLSLSLSGGRTRTPKSALSIHSRSVST